MRIVKIKGGLGNQLFQYAFAYLLQQTLNEEVKIDMATYQALLDDPIRQPRLLKMNTELKLAEKEDIEKVCLFRHSGNMLSKRYKLGIAAEGILNPKYYFEKNRAYREVDHLLKYQYFDGYWQSWRYVDKVWTELEKQFVPKNELHSSTLKMIEKVSHENSVFIGIRKGDYQNWEKHFGFLGQEYYDKAVRVIKEKISDPVFYVFSNDIAWVKQNLTFQDCEIVFREQENVVDDFEDLMIMAACRHAVIINSTYHWWGARLGDYRNKVVVAPQKWFFDEKPIDIVSPDWIRI